MNGPLGKEEIYSDNYFLESKSIPLVEFKPGGNLRCREMNPMRKCQKLQFFEYPLEAGSKASAVCYSLWLKLCSWSLRSSYETNVMSSILVIFCSSGRSFV